MTIDIVADYHAGSFLIELFVCEMRHKMCAYHIKIWHKQGCAHHQYVQELVAMGMSIKVPILCAYKHPV